MRKLFPLLLLAVGVAGAYYGLSDLRAAEQEVDEDLLLYLPNGKYLRAASLGHAGMAADLVYLWAIQFYSDYERTDRYRYVEHVFGKVIPDLDPNYIDSYSLGALIMIVEARDIDAGLRILDRGIEANPDNYILPYLAGWECYHAGRYSQAAEYMDVAVGKPGAPDLLLRHRAGFLAKSGDLRSAYGMWRELYEDEASDQYTRTVAERQMRDLHVRIDLETLEAAIAAFRQRFGRPPAGLEALVQAGNIKQVPLDPDGNSYPYDAGRGVVTRLSGQVLGGS